MRGRGRGTVATGFGPAIRVGKYNNRVVEHDGKKFDSQFEAEVYVVLKARELAREILDLRCQVPFIVHDGFTDRDGKKHLPIKYIADFVYVDAKTGEMVVTDSKGKETDVFRIKWKMFLKRYPTIRFEILKREKRGRR